jgi:hypothetical protein
MKSGDGVGPDYLRAGSAHRHQSIISNCHGATTRSKFLRPSPDGVLLTLTIAASTSRQWVGHCTYKRNRGEQSLNLIRINRTRSTAAYAVARGTNVTEALRQRLAVNAISERDYSTFGIERINLVVSAVIEQIVNLFPPATKRSSGFLLK